MKRIIALLFLGIFTFTLTACSSTGESAVNQVSEAGREIQSEANSNVLIAYYNGESGDSVKNAASLLEEALATLEAGYTLDAVDVSVESVISSLLELTGERVTDAVVEQVFSRFCVGK